MSSVAVVSDSTADLSPELAAGAGIRVVPLYVQFGEEEFQAGVNLTTEQFWTRLLAPGAPFPKTAAPSPGTFKATFEACFADGADAIVCPVIGTKLSGTFSSATLAAQALPDREIHVIDTGSTSMSTGIPALMAAEMAATGASGADIAASIRSRLPDVDLFVAVDTLDYLRKGGRLTAAQAVIGSMRSSRWSTGWSSMRSASGRGRRPGRWSSSGSPRSPSSGCRSCTPRRARPRKWPPSGSS
jgi:DegV family protein with EDD domain